MRGGRFLFGLVVLIAGIAVYLINGSIYSWVGIGLGLIILLWGLASKPKMVIMQGPGGQTMVMSGNPNKTFMVRRV